MLGALNPLPMRLGGGQTEVSRAYGMIRGAVGIGGSAPDERGIDGLWRRSRARGLAAATSSTRRALLNSFPHLATDHLPYYERILGIHPDSGSPESTRRDAVRARWTAQLSAAIPAMVEQLQSIDQRFSILPPVSGHTTQFGRTLAPLDPAGGEPPWGDSAGCSRFPNFASSFVLQLQFAVGHTGALLATEAALLEQAIAVLRSAAPSWVSWQVTTSTGFLIGVSPLGLTGLVDP